MQILTQATLDNVKRSHKRVLAQTTTAIAADMAAVGERAIEYARSHPRFTPRTGNLQRKTEWRTVKTGSGRILQLRNTAKYAAAIDEGARPHDIKGRNGGYLHFLGKRGWVRKKRVKHPGNRPYRFLYGASVVAGRLLEQRLKTSMTRIAREF